MKTITRDPIGFILLTLIVLTLFSGCAPVKARLVHDGKAFAGALLNAAEAKAIKKLQ